MKTLPGIEAIFANKIFNPFIFRAPMWSDNFEDIFAIKAKLRKYFKKLCSNDHH